MERIKSFFQVVLILVVIALIIIIILVAYLLYRARKNRQASEGFQPHRDSMSA